MTGPCGGATADAPPRRATAADVPALAALYEDCARRLGPQVYSAEQVQAWQAFARDLQGFRNYVLQPCTWLLEDEAGPLGFCGVEDDGEVRSLYVRASATRRGTGAALLAHALAAARARGQLRFAAWATPFSLAVFGRAGFRLARTVHEPFQGTMFERYRVELP
jgi:putative acetyltransferase